MIVGQHGNRANGYMGVALALPSNRYEIVCTAIEQVASTGIWPSRTRTMNVKEAENDDPKSRKIKLSYAPYVHASLRENTLVWARLRCRLSG